MGAPSQIRRLLCICAGLPRDHLDRPEAWEVQQHSFVGGMVLFTAVAATFTGFYMFSTIFESTVGSAILAICWGLMIFNLDQMLVTGMDKPDVSPSLVVIPRILVAGVIAIVVARPLEIQLFQPEIDASFAAEVSNKFQEEQAEAARKFASGRTRADLELARSRNVVENSKKEHAACLVDADIKEKAYLDEAAGTRGAGLTGLRGCGDNCKRKRQALREHKERCDVIEERLSIEREALALGETRHAANDKKLERARDDTHSASNEKASLAISDIKEGYVKGFFARHQRLSQLANDDRAIWIAVVFVGVLFLLVELVPILSKLMIGRLAAYRLLIQTEIRAAEAAYGEHLEKIESQDRLRKEMSQAYSERHADIIQRWAQGDGSDRVRSDELENRYEAEYWKPVIDGRTPDRPNRVKPPAAKRLRIPRGEPIGFKATDFGAAVFFPATAAVGGVYLDMEAATLWAVAGAVATTVQTVLSVRARSAMHPGDASR